MLLRGKVEDVISSDRCSWQRIQETDWLWNVAIKIIRPEEMSYRMNICFNSVEFSRCWCFSAEYLLAATAHVVGSRKGKDKGKAITTGKIENEFILTSQCP